MSWLFVMLKELSWSEINFGFERYGWGGERQFWKFDYPKKKDDYAKIVSVCFRYERGRSIYN